MSELWRGFRLGFGFALGATVVAATVVGATRAVSLLRAEGWRVTLTRAITSPHSGEGAVAAASRAGEPLELLSLEAERRGGRVALSGSVRNTSPQVLPDLRALVTLHDESGRVVRRSEVAVPGRLAPGRTRTFTTNVADHPKIVRYRVTFEGAAGEQLRFRDGRPPGEPGS